MTLEKSLTPRELALPPGEEWAQVHNGWTLLSVVSGEGYLLKRDSTVQIQPGDLLVFHRRWGGTLRSSALGRLSLRFCHIQPELLGGMLSLSELRRFEEQAAAPSAGPAVIPASTALAQRFRATICAKGSPSAAERCRLVQLWLEAMAIQEPGTSGDDEEQEATTLRERFHSLIGRLSVEELRGRAFGDWAKELGCSRRHFHRIFIEEFGASPRRYVKDLRLARARHYLAETDAKIINVAQQSGYNHLGLFNQMFKREFGMTPGDWRRRAVKRDLGASSRRLGRAVQCVLLPLMLVFGMAKTALADGPPAATNTTASVNAPASAAAGAKSAPATNTFAAASGFAVTNYVVEGNTLLRPGIVDSVFAPAKGKSVTFDQINKAILALQKEYRDRGYVTVLVTLPQQKLTNATIHVQVVEAPLRQITVVGNRYYGSNNIMSKLPSLKTNELLNSFVLQREIDAANTSRDRQVYTVLGPGPDPGTSALTLKVKDQMPWHARLELDNDNTPGSPALRANANTQYDNLWDADHQVGLQYSFTPEFEKYQTADVNTPFDSPLIANYSAYYRMPLGEPRGVQEAVEANPGRFGYNEATHQFVTPAPSSTASLTFYGSRATTDSGIQLGSETPIVTNNPLISINSLTPGENTTVTEDVGSKLAVPVDLVSQWKLTLEGGFDFKHYQLSSFNTNEFIEVIVTTNSGGGTTNSQTVLAPQPERQAHVNYLPLNAGIDLEEPDKWGFSTLSLGANFNVLPVGSANGDFATAAYTPDARAEYLAAKANFNRDEKIYGDWRVNLRAAGQWSPRALLSTEQFALGGINSVRGYHEGEVYGDSGWNVSIEPRVPVYEVASLGVGQHPTPCLLRLSGFFDYGQAYLASPPTGSPGHFNLCGTGLATMLNIGQHLGAQVTFAVPLIDTAFTHAGGLHFNFSLSAQF